MKRFIAFTGFLFAVLLVVFSFLNVPARTMLGQLVNFVFPITVTPQDLHDRYAAGKIKILIVPGHDNKNSGGSFRSVREADLVLGITKELLAFFAHDDRFEVTSARDTGTGEYIPQFSSYFETQKDAIRQFRDDSQAVMRALLTAKIAENKSTQNHAFAEESASLQLYGINKWANEHDIDIVLHVHLNDYPRSYRAAPGEYSGFSVYVPEPQYPNALASSDFAKPIFDELKRYVAPSDLPFERAGIVEDQELIAVGANGSRDGASVLIEYGFIYESQFVRSAVRGPVFRELAALTYYGIKKYFEGTNYSNQELSAASLLPFHWERPLRKNSQGDKDVLSLQGALHAEGLYPPYGKDLRECPINGNFGSCVEAAVKLFQEKYKEDILIPLSLQEASGVVGPATIEKLNGIFSAPSFSGLR